MKLKVKKADIGRECLIDNSKSGFYKKFIHIGKALIVDSRWNDGGVWVCKVLTNDYRLLDILETEVVSIGKKIF